MLEIFKTRTKKISFFLHQFFENEIIAEIFNFGGGDATEFLIAGSCLKDSVIKDIDIFNIKILELNEEIKLKLLSNGIEFYETKNAFSFKLKDLPTIQICNYEYANLEHMINSFDFSSTLAGMSAYFVYGDKSVKVEITKTIIKDEFINYCLSKINKFHNTKFPISSLLRREKFIKRNDILPNTDLLKLLRVFLQTKITNYTEFKEQLQAIDLMSFKLDGELDENSEAFQLYLTMISVGLIANPSNLDE